MKACQDYEVLLTLHASGALEPAEQAQVQAHLDTCAACQAEARRTAGVLSQVALPPVSALEEARQQLLPRQVVSRWRREQVHRAVRLRNVGAMMASAAAVMLVLTMTLPGWTSFRSGPLSAETAQTSETETLFEQWASADPLQDELDMTLSDDEAAWMDGDADLASDELLFLP
ncbi:zf-HC2 domain-containing protein [Stigmatella sp. ncwal1]|uniref:Zf-HC2 domain-containing protein n=1 Tax=Stigmatella ashevillensis TaxID=2995309 RepID=A0ABT5DLR9_9BACT|nr:zf-HC2 domain-containing protein [Stigmatella ashevillena]MDC0714611.1 zf-HC2 domain-containing protein [Stigmatella ashevillena]